MPKQAREHVTAAQCQAHTTKLCRDYLQAVLVQATWKLLVESIADASRALQCFDVFESIHLTANSMKCFHFAGVDPWQTMRTVSLTDTAFVDLCRLLWKKRGCSLQGSNGSAHLPTLPFRAVRPSHVMTVQTSLLHCSLASTGCRQSTLA